MSTGAPVTGTAPILHLLEQQRWKHQGLKSNVAWTVSDGFSWLKTSTFRLFSAF